MTSVSLHTLGMIGETVDQQVQIIFFILYLRSTRVGIDSNSSL